MYEVYRTRSVFGRVHENRDAHIGIRGVEFGPDPITGIVDAEDSGLDAQNRERGDQSTELGSHFTVQQL